MGNSQQSRFLTDETSDNPGVLAPQYNKPIVFHHTHSASLQLSMTQRLVKRFESNKGICFTSRPINIGERIYIRIVESAVAWKGALRFGFTADDPDTINAAELPKFACPDVTFEHGYWAKAVPDSFVRQGSILYFYITEEGRVMFGVNGEARGQLFAGVRTDILLWALMDVYGNTTAIEIIGSGTSDKTQKSTTVASNDSFDSNSSAEMPAAATPRISKTIKSLAEARAASLPPPHSSRKRPNGLPPPPLPMSLDQSPEDSSTTHESSISTTRERLSSHKGMFSRARVALGFSQKENRDDVQFSKSVVAEAAATGGAETMDSGRPTERRITELLDPMPFHFTIGLNISLSTDRMIATRLSSEYSNGYVFTSRPLKPGERLMVSILKVDKEFSNSLAFGMTSCDPATVKTLELPDNSDLLLDRGEYWVTHKDVCNKAVPGDQLSFHLADRGEVRYSRNGRNIGTLMHVDCSMPLWAFLDLYGSTQQIQILGVSRRSRDKATIAQQSRSAAPAIPPRASERNNVTKLLSPGASEASPSISNVADTNNYMLPQRHRASNTQPIAMNVQAPIPANEIAAELLVDFTQASAAAMPNSLSLGAAPLVDSGLPAGAVVFRHHHGSKHVNNLQQLPASSTNRQIGDKRGTISAQSGLSSVNTNLAGQALIAIPQCPRPSTVGPDSLTNDSHIHNTVVQGDRTDTGFNRIHRNSSRSMDIQTTLASAERYARQRSQPARSSNLFDEFLPTLPPPLIPVPQSPAATTTDTSSQSVPRDTHMVAAAAPGVANTRLSLRNSSLPNIEQTFVDSRGGISVTSEASGRSGETSSLGDLESTGAACVRNDAFELQAVSDALVAESLGTTTVPGSPHSPSYPNYTECVVCLERAADSALYMCGHMCLCYRCAHDIMKKPNALCPICRQTIRDVIRIFRP